MINPCRIVGFPHARDRRGTLTFIEAGDHAPFTIRRVYYLTGVPAGGRRGGHWHTRLEELLIAVAGSLDVIVDDGRGRGRFRLDAPTQGLYVPSDVWHEMENFSPGAVCLVLASQHYDPDEHQNDYDEFVASRPDMT